MSYNDPLKRRIYNAADQIVKDYQMGRLTRSQAHRDLTNLHDTVFSMYDFRLSGKVDPGEVQEYIHELQGKYTTIIAE